MTAGKKMRIGESLIRAGAITPDQLQLALESQQVYGGRLGTNLVELGILSVDELARELARYFSLPDASPEAYRLATDEVLAMVPATTCARFQVFPLKTDEQRRMLHLAMSDPSRLDTIDELQFALNVRIRPYSTPEIRLLYYLEQRYGLHREARYVRLFDNTELSDEESSAGGMQIEGIALGGGVEDPLMRGVSLDRVSDILHSNFAVEANERVLDIPVLGGEVTTNSAMRRSPDVLRHRIQQARTEADVARMLSLADMLGGTLAVVFAVQPDKAIAAYVSGVDVADSDASSISVSLNVPSLLRAAVHSKKVLLSGQPDPLQAQVAGHFGHPLPQQTLVVPVLRGDAAELLLLIQSSVPGGLSGEVVENMRQLGVLAQMSLRRIAAAPEIASAPPSIA